MNAAKPLVIVGASYAGLQIAAHARELGFDAPILLVGDERHAPYHRPPLSKGLLMGKTTEDQLELRSPAFFAEQHIQLLSGTRVVSFDAAVRRLSLHEGKQIEYGWLAIATGASPRVLNLPGAELEGVFNLRTLDDAHAVRAAAAGAERVCVIGGGYIGLEVAAALRSTGKQVTVLEGAQRLLMRSMPASMSAYVEQAHRSRGVDLRTMQTVRSLRGHLGNVVAVQLADDTEVECDMVVLGIGVTPNQQIAADAGLETSNGIHTDPHGRTSAPNVVAAGDVACVEQTRWADAHPRLRLESIQAANDGAKCAAGVVSGRLQKGGAVPWFWSDQFDLKFQMAGVPLPADQPVLRGSMGDDKFSVGYLRDGVLVAMQSVNRPAEHMLSRKLVGANVRITAAQIADLSFDLKKALSSEELA